MTDGSDRVRHLLLDLLSAARPIAQASVDRLDAADWRLLLSLARQHRLEPMVHWRLRHDHAALVVPDGVRARLADRHRAAGLWVLAMQRDLVLVRRRLDQAGIPHCFLKGAFLAWQAYPRPGLRPMRDLDLWVPRDRGLDAFALLEDAGMVRVAGHDGTPEAWLAHYRHLPALRSPQGVAVELHVALYDGAASDTGIAAPGEAAWRRRIQVDLAGGATGFLAPTDLLLHLIVHAVYQHRLDTGPLLLTDLACLLARYPIDWPEFWRLADLGGHRRGCALALALAERYGAEGRVAWPAGMDGAERPAGPLLDALALLTLRDFAARRDVHFQHELRSRRSVPARAAVLLGKAFPGRRELALFHAGEAGLPWWIGGYLKKWRWLAGKRLPEYLGFLRRSDLAPQVDQLARLEQWLAGGAG